MAGKGKTREVFKKFQGKRSMVKKVEREALTRGSIRRMARRGGVKRISDGLYGELRDFFDNFIAMVVKDITVYTEHAKRKTISAIDVTLALKKQGRTLYGYGIWRPLWNHDDTPLKST